MHLVTDNDNFLHLVSHGGTTTDTGTCCEMLFEPNLEVTSILLPLALLIATVKIHQDLAGDQLKKEQMQLVGILSFKGRLKHQTE